LAQGLGSPYPYTANWNSLTPGDKEIVRRVLVNYRNAIEAYLEKTGEPECTPSTGISDDDFHVIGLHVDTNALAARRAGDGKEGLFPLRHFV
jgi:hypothetical protein